MTRLEREVTDPAEHRDAPDRRHDLRSGAERRVRAAWREEAGVGLRSAAALFGAAVDLRNFAYDIGVVSPRRAPLPVVSVGGLTVGGSGKTPVTSELARWALLSDLRPAVLTRGFADELEVHAHLLPEAVVMGHPNRHRAAVRAYRAGARIAYLDDGFQHRRLARDVDVVLVDVDLLVRTSRLRLPAGPYRERWSSVGRADAVVFVRRRRSVSPEGLLAWARRRLPECKVASCRLRPGGIEPFSSGARRVLDEGDEPAPGAAVASVMKPELFLEQVAKLGIRPSEAYLLPDHGRPTRGLLERLEGKPGGGVIGTLKDVVKLRGELAPATPLWYLTDEVVWESGREALRRLVTHGALSRSDRRKRGPTERARATCETDG